MFLCYFFALWWKDEKFRENIEKLGLIVKPAGEVVLAQFVIPAKAGIQQFPFYSAMDAHFRGHDSFLFKLSQHRRSDVMAYSIS